MTTTPVDCRGEAAKHILLIVGGDAGDIVVTHGQLGVDIQCKHLTTQPMVIDEWLGGGCRSLILTAHHNIAVGIDIQMAQAQLGVGGG